MRHALRLVYTDLVRRRSRVRVLPADAVIDRVRPIFLVGVYRSGTTLLRYVVDSHSEVACPPESNFLVHLRPLLEERRALEGLDAMGFDREHVQQRVRAFADYFFANYARSQGKPRWADKCPAYVDHLDLIESVFPDACHVVIHRHPLDQVESFTKGGTHVRPPVEPYVRAGEDPRVAGARYWTACTEHVEQFTARTAAATTTIRYEDLCRDPERVLRGVLSHLDIAWEPAVLEHHRHRHDLGMEAARARASRGFVPSINTWRHWPPDIVERCWEVVAGPASRLGYEAPTAVRSRPGRPGMTARGH